MCRYPRAGQTKVIVERSRFANCRTSSTTLLKNPSSANASRENPRRQ
jgi:hypothetical protein